MPIPPGRSQMKQLNALAVASLVLAATPFAAAHAEGDPALGRQLAYTCTGCHGIAGYKNAYPQYHVPRIAGQNYEYLLAALTAYKNGERRSEEHTSELQSLMRISYAVLCLKKKTRN